MLDNQTITNLNLPLLLINSKEFGKRYVALFLGVSRLWSQGTLNNRIKSQNFLILSQFITTAPLLASALAEFCTLTQSKFELKSHRDGNKWHVFVPFANMSRLIYQFLKDFLKGKDSLHIRILFHLISLCYKLLIVWLSCLESWHCNEPRYKRTRTMQNYKMTDSSYWYKKAFKKCFFFYCNDYQSFNHCEWVIELSSFNTIRDDVNFRLFLLTRFVLSLE